MIFLKLLTLSLYWHDILYFDFSINSYKIKMNSICIKRDFYTISDYVDDKTCLGILLYLTQELTKSLVVAQQCKHILVLLSHKRNALIHIVTEQALSFLVVVLAIWKCPYVRPSSLLHRSLTAEDHDHMWLSSTVFDHGYHGPHGIDYHKATNRYLNQIWPPIMASISIPFRFQTRNHITSLTCKYCCN